ncbi:hypothetical protein HQ590_07215 [bacterium]|nr:hypothetical protein [bacterium]
MTIGGFAAIHNGAGYVEVANNSTMVLSNGYLLVSDKNYLAATNTLVLNGSTIKLGKPGSSGVLTNRGIMKASGTITGMGSSPALVRSEGVFAVGNSIGTLTLNNANLELAPGSQTSWEFSDTGLDQIIINGGSASLLGSNTFALASGSAPLAPGVKWGLGAYNFVVVSNVTWNPQYADLTNLLNAAGLQQGLD